MGLKSKQKLQKEKYETITLKPINYLHNILHTCRVVGVAHRRHSHSLKTNNHSSFDFNSSAHSATLIIEQTYSWHLTLHYFIFILFIYFNPSSAILSILALTNNQSFIYIKKKKINAKLLLTLLSLGVGRLPLQELSDPELKYEDRGGLGG